MKKNKNVGVWMGAGFCVLTSWLLGADITWGPAQDISAETDVLTEGTLRYAYFAQKTTATGLYALRTVTNEVNGVKMSGNVRVYASNLNPKLGNCGGTNSSITTTLDMEADIWLEGEFSGSAWNFRCDPCTTIGSPTVSDAYVKVLTNMVTCAGGAMTVTNTLRKLVSGRKYKIQYWCNQVGNTGSCTIKDMNKVTQVTLKRSVVSGENRWGQFTVGTFTADSDSQKFICTTSAAGGAWNIIQVRDVTRANGTAFSFF